MKETLLAAATLIFSSGEQLLMAGLIQLQGFHTALPWQCVLSKNKQITDQLFSPDP